MCFLINNASMTTPTPNTNRMDTVKEVEPLAPLRPLPAHVVDPEDHVLDVELHLHHGEDDHVDSEGEQNV